MNSQIREEAVWKVQLTELNLQDQVWQFSEMTEDEFMIFSNKFSSVRPYEFQDKVHMQITFEFDLTLYRVDRDVYSILDWIGDVGGLNEGICVGLSVVLAFCQFNKFDHALIENLFQKSNKKSRIKEQEQGMQEKSPLEDGGTTWGR